MRDEIEAINQKKEESKEEDFKQKYEYEMQNRENKHIEWMQR